MSPYQKLTEERAEIVREIERSGRVPVMSRDIILNKKQASSAASCRCGRTTAGPHKNPLKQISSARMQ